MDLDVAIVQQHEVILGFVSKRRNRETDREQE